MEGVRKTMNLIANWQTERNMFVLFECLFFILCFFLVGSICCKYIYLIKCYIFHQFSVQLTILLSPSDSPLLIYAYTFFFCNFIVFKNKICNENARISYFGNHICLRVYNNKKFG